MEVLVYLLIAAVVGWIGYKGYKTAFADNDIKKPTGKGGGGYSEPIRDDSEDMPQLK